METKKYVVVLNRGVDYQQFWDEIENSSNGLEHIPDRPIAIANNLDSLDRITHYFLTDEEAGRLRNDPRVLGVQIPAELRDDIEIVSHTVQANNFTKTTSSTGDFVNWGLIRNSNPTNVYGTGTTTSQNYNYVLDGSNVDVVIIDSGIQANHPEFQYSGNTTSRLNQYIWYPGLNPTTYYTDTDGHGTHVAGIVAGKTYGWAKNANIYALKYSGEFFDDLANYVITWHNNKPINPVTGVKNPSVVNMSFAYFWGSVTSDPAEFTIDGVGYRGLYYPSPGWDSPTYGTYFRAGRIPYREPTYDAAVDQMTDAGITVCKSAGNNGLKIDRPSGVDWDNNIDVIRNSNGVYVLIGAPYMQGSSPMGEDSIMVGALDTTTFSSTLDRKAVYSDAGPGVDIFAAGSRIMSACSNTTTLGTPGNYFWDSSFKQINISGTSMSCPQVAGAAALYLQAHPTATPIQVKAALTSVATNTMIGNIATNPTGSDYSNTVSQWGGNAGVTFQSIQGITQIKGSDNNWQSPANISIKTDVATWTTVNKIWNKTANGWIQTY